MTKICSLPYQVPLTGTRDSRLWLTKSHVLCSLEYCPGLVDCSQRHVMTTSHVISVFIMSHPTSLTYIHTNFLHLTCDGASTNRGLWNLHGKGKDTSEKGVLYKVLNIYATDPSHCLYFIYDPPHLIKTTRNCWANKSRSLQVSWKLSGNYRISNKKQFL